MLTLQRNILKIRIIFDVANAIKAQNIATIDDLSTLEFDFDQSQSLQIKIAERQYIFHESEEELFIQHVDFVKNQLFVSTKTIVIFKFDWDITRIFDHDKEIFFVQLSSVAIEIVKIILSLAKTNRLLEKRDVVSIVVEKTNYRIFHVEIDSNFVERYHFLRRIE